MYTYYVLHSNDIWASSQYWAKKSSQYLTTEWFFFFFWELQPFTSHATDLSRQRWSYLSLSNDVFWGVNADIGESSAFTRWKYSNVGAAWFSFSQSADAGNSSAATGRVRQIKADNYFSQLFVCSMHSRVGEWNKRKEEAVKILQSIQKPCVKCTRGQKNLTNLCAKEKRVG